MRYSPLEEMESNLPRCFTPAFANNVSIITDNQPMVHAHICKSYTGLIYKVRYATYCVFYMCSPQTSSQ